MLDCNAMSWQALRSTCAKLGIKAVGKKEDLIQQLNEKLPN